MAVTITNNLITPTNGDANATTGWTGTDAPALYTTFFREATGCLGYGTSNGVDDAYVTIASTAFDNGAGVGFTLFGWINLGIPATTANGGYGLLLGDGTNDRVYAVGGSDNYGHFVNGWSGFRLDGRVLPATFRNPRGAAPNLAAITRIGYGWNYAIAALGKVDTSFHDVIRYIANGSAALTIGGGITGDRGTFSQVVADDASTAGGKAYGIFRILTSGSKAIEMTYGVDFGNSGTASTYFQDSNFQLVIVGTNMSAGNMDVDLLSNTTGTNLFSLQDGVMVGVGTVSNWNLNTANINTLQFNRMSCTNVGTISFPSSGGTLRESISCIFNNCGQISIGNNFTFTGHSFNGTTNATGALLLDNVLDVTNVSGLTFNSDGTGHGILITAPGTYTFNDFTFVGYGADATTNAAVYNNSGGLVTINVIGGTSPTFLNGAGASTVVVAGTVTAAVKVTTTAGVNVENANVFVKAAPGGPFPVNASVTIVNSGTTATVTHTSHGLASGDKVFITGANLIQNRGVYTITVTGTTTYTYVMGSAPGASPTGTITSTFMVLSGFTDASGNISMSRVFPSSQPITGWARKSTTQPFYKTGGIGGTVSSTLGLNTTIQLLPD